MADAFSYQKAGVDIDVADAAKRDMAASLEPGDDRVLNRLGAFASLFAAKFPGIDDPVLVFKTEEPGTKQKLALEHDRAESIARDMIHHLINDIAVMGARPLMVQDAIICGKMQKDVVNRLVAAMAAACRENDCTLVGGETSEQPGVLAEGMYVLTSSVVGVVDRAKIIDGSAIVEGDVVLAAASNGLHTNGYSLVRALLRDIPDLARETVASAEADGAHESFLDAVLRPHRCYYQALRGLFESPALHGLAHITGGGVAGNLNRVLPRNLDARINVSSYRVPQLFKLIRQRGAVDEADMLRTFNMGVGLALVVPAAEVGDVVEHLQRCACEAYPIGRITAGSGRVRLVGKVNW